MCTTPDPPDPVEVPPPPPPPKPITDALDTSSLRNQLRTRARLGTNQLRVKRPSSVNTPG